MSRPHYEGPRGLTPLHLAIIRTLATGFSTQATAAKHKVSTKTVYRVRGSKPGKIALPKAIQHLANEETRAFAVRNAMMMPGA